MMKQSRHNACLNTALRLLARRDHACSELKRKLKQRRYESEEIDAVLTECRRLNYLDDRKYTFSQIEHLRRKGYGPHRIQQILKTKGLASDLISKAIEKNCTAADQIQDCRNTLSKKIRQSHNTHLLKENRARLYRFLLQRGYPTAVVQHVMNEEPEST